MKKHWKIRRLLCLLLVCALLSGFGTGAFAAEEEAEKEVEALPWELASIGAGRACEAGVTGSGVRIALIDSGLSPLPSLSRALEGRDYTDTGEEDTFGHGTFIASLLIGDGSEGVLGVAPEASLIPLKAFSEKVGDPHTVVRAIYAAVDEFDCQVVSLSFGQAEDNPEMRAAVEYALAAGAVVVAASGNGASDELSYPAAYEGVLSVSAVGRTGKLAGDARHNGSIDLVAPGVGVTGLALSGNTARRSGSSYAVAYVSGAAAVLLSAFPELTAAEVCSILCETAQDLGEPGRDNDFGCGFLRLDSALERLTAEKAAAENAHRRQALADTWMRAVDCARELAACRGEPFGDPGAASAVRRLLSRIPELTACR